MKNSKKLKLKELFARIILQILIKGFIEIIFY